MPRLIATCFLAATLTACTGQDPESVWIGAVSEIAVPAGAGSRFPHLVGTPDGASVMSWLEPIADGEFSLRQATWNGAGWTPPGTVATGRDWFVNWADFPSVVPLDDRSWAAHWLQQKPGDVFSYDVRISVSEDAGQHWSTPMTPHDDGTPTEHGFVTLFPADDALQAVWLDGRHTAGEHHAEANSDGAMTLRSATIGPDGRLVGSGIEIDARVCDCCQTDAALTADGAVVVYRDRSEDGIRDIALLRRGAQGWSAPTRVARDDWRINACPVNGPAVDARGSTVAVAWFTAAGAPRVQLAFSSDGGQSFAAPIQVARNRVAGRVDVVLLRDGRAVVSWLADGPTGAELRARPFAAAGPAGREAVIARSSVSRASGFPQMVRARDGLLFAWTQPGDPPSVRAAFARLD